MYARHDGDTVPGLRGAGSAPWLAGAAPATTDTDHPIVGHQALDPKNEGEITQSMSGDIGQTPDSQLPGREWALHAAGLLNRYEPLLQEWLTPTRLRHSVDVMQVMGDLTAMYSLDPVRALTVGLLHDTVRDLEQERQLALVKEGCLALAHPCERHPVYLHGPVGAYLVDQIMGVDDEAILDAIATHSYAGDGLKLDMPLSRCLRAADLVAAVREWKGRKKLRRMIYSGRIEEATLLHSTWLIEYLVKQGVPIHPNLRAQVETLARKIPVSESFFDRW